MSFTAAIDISTFVWCHDDFHRNKHDYYQLIDLSPTIYEQISANKIPALLRAELYNLLLVEFPYANINEINPDFGRITLSFLINAKWVIYEDSDDPTILATPDIVKSHFNDSLKNEVRYQIVHLFEASNPQNKFITYRNFYKDKRNLLINKSEAKVEVETLFYQSENEIVRFFEKYKIKFKHNPKHDKYKAGGKISPLTCYNERLMDNTQAQKLLETAYQIGVDFYNYDEMSGVYVIFVTSNDGTYHGFDLSDERDNVPEEVKSKFNKNGRKF